MMDHAVAVKAIRNAAFSIQLTDAAAMMAKVGGVFGL
jgi:hypothetical protein